MSPLNWFRFKASEKDFLKCLLGVMVFFGMLAVIGHADDLDGDGYDDDTGEYLGDPGTYDSTTDSDGDGLTDEEEVNGIEIWIDFEQFSHTETYYDEATGVEYSHDVYYTNSYSEYVYPDPGDPDSDDDWLPDGYEYGLGLNPLDASDGNSDEDGDGLTRGEEYLIGSDPNDPNSPENSEPPLEDGSDDGSADTSGDSTSGTTTDTTAPETDDSTESEIDDDAADSVSEDSPQEADPSADSTIDDSGGLTISDLSRWGAVYGISASDANAMASDADGDGLTNEEEFQIGTNPNATDTDSDGIDDGDEINGYPQGVGYSVWEEVYYEDYDPSTGDTYYYSNYEEVWIPAPIVTSDPLNYDTDGDGIQDGLEFGNSGSGSGNYNDSDGDYLYDDDEISNGTNPNAYDTDGDGLSDSEEIWGVEVYYSEEEEYTYYYQEEVYDESTGEYYYEDVEYTDYYTNYWSEYVTTSPTNPDSDGDGLPDGYEVWNQLNPNDSSDGNEDGDGDGLTRGQEYQIGTHDNVANGDLDSDGLSDAVEVLEFSPLMEALGFPPFDPNDDSDGLGDFDLDGLSNAEEYALGTSFLDPDTDNDGFSDGDEILAGTDPLDENSPGAGTGSSGGGDTGPTGGGGSTPDSGTTTGGNPSSSDPLPDPFTALTHQYTYSQALFDGPFRYQLENYGDRDGDGLDDQWEFHWFGGSTRFDAGDDTDGDGLTLDLEQTFGSSPFRADSDGDGLSDLEEYLNNSDPWSADGDSDGYTDSWEIANGTNPVISMEQEDDLDGDGIPDAYTGSAGDSDGDGLSASQEFSNKTDPQKFDTDEDGLSDGSEVLTGGYPFEYYYWSDTGTGWEYVSTQITEYVDPLNLDSDGDGFSDGYEVASNASPVDPNSTPFGDSNTSGEVIHSDGTGDSEDPGSYSYTDYDSNLDLYYYVENGLRHYEDGSVRDQDGNVIPASTTSIAPALFSQDSDGDWISDGDEIKYFGTDPNEEDTDGDGFSDGDEVFYFLTDPLDPNHYWYDADSDGLRDDFEILFGLSTSSSDSDGDGFSDYLEFRIGSDFSSMEIDDADGDGYLDTWEIMIGSDPDDSSDPDGTADPDEDGLTTAEEALLLTDPFWADTDGDFLSDGLEALVYGTDPLDWDTDGDGSPDGLEVFWYGTNPLDDTDVVVDSDGDWLPDDWEIANSLDANTADDASADADGDGLTNYEEYWLGGNPQHEDTDGDGINDLAQFEEGRDISDNGSFTTVVADGEANADFDNDGMSDRYEGEHGLNPFDASDAALDLDGDGLTNLEEVSLGTNVGVRDTDGDGVEDEPEFNTYGTDPLLTDSDEDGLDDNYEISNAGFDPLDPADGLADGDLDDLSFASELYYGTDPANDDSDGDDMSDGFEVENGFDPLDDSDGLEDADGDGLTNGEEFLLGTGLNNEDSDGDTLSDGWEVANGTDPLDISSGGYDYDGDGLSNVREVELGLAFDNPDTDGDLLPDGWELKWGFDPLTPTNSETDDADNDGVTDFQEYLLGTNPNPVDTDGDGMSDEWEEFLGTDPNQFNVRDSDGDQIDDAWELYYFGSIDYENFSDYVAKNQEALDNGEVENDWDGDGMTEYDEFIARTNPLKFDTDDDGLSDGAELQIGQWEMGFEDSWEDETSSEPVMIEVWVENWEDVWVGYDESTGEDIYESVDNGWYDWIEDPDASGGSGSQEGPTITDPVNPDTDGDLLPDGYETNQGLDPNDPADGNADSDGDILTRGEEYFYGTLRTNPDTDGDGISDGIEVLFGTDPLDDMDPGSDLEEEETQLLTDAQSVAGAQQVAKIVNELRDSDGDGVSDATEIRNGTDPRSASSTLPHLADQNCSPTAVRSANEISSLLAATVGSMQGGGGNISAINSAAMNMVQAINGSSGAGDLGSESGVVQDAIEALLQNAISSAGVGTADSMSEEQINLLRETLTSVLQGGEGGGVIFSGMDSDVVEGAISTIFGSGFGGGGVSGGGG